MGDFSLIISAFGVVDKTGGKIVLSCLRDVVVGAIWLVSVFISVLVNVEDQWGTFTTERPAKLRA